MTTKSELLNFLQQNNIRFFLTSDHVEVIDCPVHIYPIDNAYELRTPSFDDKGGVPKTYFYDISVKNEHNGIRTIWIKPWEFLPDTHCRKIMESIILNACKKINNTFNARDCVIQPVGIDELKPFLVANSNYGFRGSSLALGLYLNKDYRDYSRGTLLMVYTFGHPFFGHKKYDIELIRGTTLHNCSVRGGASKLWAHFLSQYSQIVIAKRTIQWNTMVYYVDFDHYNGNSLPHLGYKFQYYSQPGFMNVYSDTHVPFHRKPQQHKEMMKLLRAGEIYTVYNAGVKVYTYNKNELL